MICSVCKKEVDNGTVICPFCGAFLEEKDENVIEVSFKKPAPPPLIELSFIEPVASEPEYIEPEIIEPEYVEPEYVEPEYVEPVVEEPPYVEFAPTPKKEAKQKKKSKDRINFFYLLLSLLWAPYPGIVLWVAKSKKTPKAAQAYGICAIVMYLLRCLGDIIMSFVVKTVAVLTFIILAVGTTVVLYMIQFGYIAMPI